jgi:hypothetical protein
MSAEPCATDISRVCAAPAEDRWPVREDTCWRCGARWADEPQRAAKLRVVLPAVLTMPDVCTADAAGAANVDADRWANKGGAFAVPDRAADAAGSGGRR